MNRCFDTRLRREMEDHFRLASRDEGNELLRADVELMKAEYSARGTCRREVRERSGGKVVNDVYLQ